MNDGAIAHVGAAGQQLAQRLDGCGRRERVLLGEAAIDLAAHLVDETMRRIRRVVHQLRAVHAGGGAELIGKCCRRRKRQPPAQAIADGALGAFARRLAIEEFQHRADVGHRHAVGQMAHVGVHLVLRRLRDRDERLHPALLVAILVAHLAAPVPEVRHRDVIADDRDLPRNVEQLLAQAPDVHQHDHRGKRSALLRMDHEASMRPSAVGMSICFSIIAV